MDRPAGEKEAASGCILNPDATAVQETKSHGTAAAAVPCQGAHPKPALANTPAACMHTPAPVRAGHAAGDSEIERRGTEGGGDSNPTPRRAIDRGFECLCSLLAVQCGEKLRAWKVSGSLFARHGRLGHAREGITNAARHGTAADRDFFRRTRRRKERDEE